MKTAAITALLKALPRKLARIRGEEYSQRAWAQRIGVSQQNVNRWENSTIPDIHAMILLAVDENINLNWLLAGKGSMYRD